MKQKFALAFAALLLSLSSAHSQQWPTKTVRFIVPFGAGSTPDTVARLVADHLQTKLGQNFIVENKPGASGNLGTDAIAKATPDGSTIGVSIVGPLAINTLLFSKLSYDPFKDIAPITVLADQPSVLAVNGEVPAKTTGELIELLKREPGKYNFGSIGNGSLSHLAMEALATKSGAKLVHVPYGSSPQAVTALIRGDVQIVCLPAISVVSQVQSGKIRILAVSSAKRSPLLPDVPTLAEAGIDVEANAWIGLVGPAGLSADVVAIMRDDALEAINTPAIRDKLKVQFMEPRGDTPAEFKARIQSEIKRWKPVIESAGIKIN